MLVTHGCSFGGRCARAIEEEGGNSSPLVAVPKLRDLDTNIVVTARPLTQMEPAKEALVFKAT